MALYDDNGELIGYRFKTEPEPPVKSHLYEVGSKVLLNIKDLSESFSIAVSIA